MISKRALVVVATIAGLVGGGFWFAREQRVSECRRAAVSVSQPAYDFGNPKIEAGLAIARQMDAEKVAECYRAGLLATPRG